MRYFTFLLLFSLGLSVFAQKKMTIRNSETGEEMTITIPDGLVITVKMEISRVKGTGSSDSQEWHNRVM